MTRAVLLAAGLGSRLKPWTDKCPKHLLEIGETTIIHRTVSILREAGVEDVSIVAGHLKERYYEAFPSGVRFFVNPDYAKTDQAESLSCAIGGGERGDSLVVAGDLFAPRGIFRKVLEDPNLFCVAVGKREDPFDDLTEKVLVKGDQVVKIGKLNVANGEANGEFLGLTRIRKEALAVFENALRESIQENRKCAIVHVLQRLIDGGNPVARVECRQPWCEIDDFRALKKARMIFKEIPSY